MHFRDRIRALSINSREWLVLDHRVNKDFTLQEVGEDILGISRERVRQVQKHSIKKILSRSDAIQPILECLENGVEMLWVPFEEGSDFESAVDALKGIIDEYESASVNEDDVYRLITVVRSLSFRGFRNFESLFPNISFLLCALSPTIDNNPSVVEEIQRRKESARRLTYKELAERVLKKVNNPLHWRAIARQAEQLNRRENFSYTAQYNSLLNFPDTFVRVDQGTYGLRAWGLEDVDPYPDIIADVLHVPGEPLTYGRLLKSVDSIRVIKGSSLQMYLDLHPRFYKSINNLYGLRVWLTKRHDQTLKTPRPFVESPKSYKRVAAAELRGYVLENVLKPDREKMMV